MLDPGVPKLTLLHRACDRGVRGCRGLGDDDALAGREAIGLHDDREPELAAVDHRRAASPRRRRGSVPSEFRAAP